MMKPLYCLIFSCLAAIVAAQTPVIVLPKSAPESDRRAAQVLQFYLQKITAGEVSILENEVAATAGQPLIFFQKLADAAGKSPIDSLPPDAYFLKSEAGRAVISGGGDMGAEYAVYDFLETIGCRKYSPRDSFLPKIPNLRLPEIAAKVETPAFPYRELHYEPAMDEGWARWHRVKTQPRKKAEWGLFVHTFERLCPAAEHFAAHPEWFAWNGRLRSAGQLCLSNDTVWQVVVGNLRRLVRERPEAIYWSVSQNDNFDYCKCPRCAASDRALGGPAGTLLAFVNRVAAEFPEKIISTLAYQYTRRAPVNIRPAGNVSVCLCSIECNRGRALADDPGSADFVRDMEEWSKLTPNLMIWDYVVQFRDYLSPFPNWQTLQPNLQLFRKHGTRMVFEQGSGHSRSEFSEMRAYLLAKLMWNPEVAVDSVLGDFARGYYGAAAPFVLRYLDSLTANLNRTDRRLIIYGTPATARDSWLDEKQIAKYLVFLDKAGGTLLPNGAEINRVLAAALPLIHADLEQVKFRRIIYPCDGPDSLAEISFCHHPNDWATTKEFPIWCEKLGFEVMNESGYTPRQYIADLQKFMREGRVLHRFVQRKMADGQAELVDLQLLEAPSKKYVSGNPQILLDSYRGTEDYNFNWLGFEGNNLVATLRLPDSLPQNQLPKASKLSVQFLQDQQSWVFLPKKVELEISEDGQKFRPVQTVEIETVPDGKKAIRRVEAVLPGKTAVRAVRVSAENIGVCPAWHNGNGLPCWIFVDEIVVE